MDYTKQAATMSTAKKRSVWSERNEQILLELWRERADELRRTKRNRHIYVEISMQMGSKFSAQEVHVKIRNLTQRYREEKKKLGPSGESSWKYFTVVRQIMENTAAKDIKVLESFSLDNISGESCSLLSPLVRSPSPKPLPSPEPLQPLPPTLSVSMPLPFAVVKSESLSLPQSPVETPPSPVADAASPISRKKRKANHLSDVVKIMKEHNVMLKSVLEDSKLLSNEIVNAIREQNETTKELVNIMRILVDKM